MAAKKPVKKAAPLPKIKKSVSKKQLGRPRAKGAGRTEQQEKEEQQFYQCPSGHGLPHMTDAGNCTPVHCAGSTRVHQKKAEKVAKELANKARRNGAITEGADDVEVARVIKAKSRRQARMEALEIPTNLKGSDAEEWADQKLTELLPEAVAELEFKLKFGDDDQRDKAAQKVLDATGRGKRENGAGGTAPIIMISGAGPMPWMQRIDPKKIGSGQ